MIFVHKASKPFLLYLVGIVDYSWIKRSGHHDDLPSPFSSDSNNYWNYASSFALALIASTETAVFFTLIKNKEQYLMISVC